MNEKTTEEDEKKKNIGRQDKHLLDEASNAQWQKLQNAHWAKNIFPPDKHQKDKVEENPFAT